MKLKISISIIWEHFSPYTVHLHACGQQGRHSWNFIILHSKGYQNINFDQMKNRDINMMITYLIFNQNCNFLATHVDARSWNCDILLSSVDSSRCPAKWQTRFWKLKLKSNKLGDLRNLYPKIVVFELEFFIFWSWFRVWTWKYQFPKFLNILFFP